MARELSLQRIMKEVAQQSCQSRALRSAITSSSFRDASEDTDSFSVDREGSMRSMVLTASISTFCILGIQRNKRRGS